MKKILLGIVIGIAVRDVAQELLLQWEVRERLELARRAIGENR